MSGVCRFFNTSSGCRYGNRCRFEHVPQNRTATGSRSVACRFFRTDRGCRFGKRCYYSHDQPTGRSLSTSASSSSPSSSVEASSSGGNVSTGVKNPKDVDEVAEAMNALLINDCRAVVLYDPENPVNLFRAAVICASQEERAKCSRCKKSFDSEPTPEASEAALTRHYIEMLARNDRRHMEIFYRHEEFEHLDFYCIRCESYFETPHSLFQHIRSKMRNKKNPVEAKLHESIFEMIVEPLVDLDVGRNFEDEEDMVDVLAVAVSKDGGFDDDEDDEDFSSLSTLLAAARVLSKMDEHGGDLDASDYSEDGGMFGFSASDVEELLCQGIKPWDPEAEAALAILNGDYDYY